MNGRVLAIALGNSLLWSVYLLLTRHVVSGAHLDAWAYTLVQLLSAGLAMLWQRRPLPDDSSIAPSWREPVIGGVLGLLAGIVGIGGGIFLAPVLHMMRWGGAKAIAGTCAVFILVNSLAGLTGQLAKSGTNTVAAMVVEHWLLFPAVAIGGLVGALVGSGPLKQRHVAVLTALLVLYVGGQLTLRFLKLLGTGV